MFKDELGRKVKVEICTLRPKTYAYLMNDDSEMKKAKRAKKSALKRGLRFESYKDCLFNKKIILKKQQIFKSDYHEMYKGKVNKIALSCNNEKKLQTCDRITTYPHGTNAFKVCESEMLSKMQRKM